HLPTVSPQPYTHLAHEGLEYSREHGRADAYNDAVFRAFFQRSEDIGNPEVLARIAAGVSLDTAEFRAALDMHRYSEVTAQKLREAERLGITAVPTMFVGRRALAGLYPEAVLASVIDEELQLLPR
ncbi:MAG TPA: DsbA family protein, partial [Terriglobales bacterium]